MSKTIFLKTTILLVLFTSLGLCLNLSAQLDLIINTDEVNKDEHIFIPGRWESQIVNRCGNIINHWDHETYAGLTGRLTHDGYLLRAGATRGCCPQASTGGLIELLEYDGTVKWSYEFANDSLQQHHDLQYLPNGNIIFLGWEIVDREERIALGKEEFNSTLWSEFVYEIKPIGTNSFDLIWEWHLKDHLIQDKDPTKSNYADIASSLGKVNINFWGDLAFSSRDWWHANALDYNAERNEILVNSRANGETWIIDHSTTSEEAKGNTGGNRGKGGQLLFRWGNPATHNAGERDEKLQYGSHGHNWIKPGLPDAGKILFFNNGDLRPDVFFWNTYSTIEMIEPAYDSLSNYVIENSKFKIKEHQVIYGEDPSKRFHSEYRSNAEQLPSGGFLINAANSGKLFEINNEKEIIWEINGPLGFKAHMHPVDYSGFENQEFPEISYSSVSRSVFCSGIPTILFAETDSDSILWSTGETSFFIEVSSPGSYFYETQDACSDKKIRHLFELEPVPPLESTTISATQGEFVIINLGSFNSDLFQEVFWYEFENSMDPIAAGAGFFLLDIQNDTTLWVAHGPSTDCLSERAPIHVDVMISDIKEVDEISSIRVYPNPANEELIIDTGTQEKYSFQLMDLNGKIILASDQRQLDLKGLAPGCYFLSVISEGGQLIHSEKIIKVE